MKPLFKIETTVIAVCACVTMAHAQTWVPARLIAPPAHKTKGLNICPAATGGFHFVYIDTVFYHLRYIRYHRNDTWTAPTTVKTGNFIWNTFVTESGSGTIWVVWENHADGASNCHAARSDDGGNGWGQYVLSNFSPGAVKSPAIVRLGGVYSHEALATFVNLSENRMYYNRFDGFRFLGPTQIPGAGCNSHYWCTGSSYSPADGGVYRTYGRNSNVYINFFDGVQWQGETELKNDGQFFAWPEVSAAATGHVMASWEFDQRIYSRVRIPGQGWMPAVSFSGRAMRITPIGERPEFYMTYVKMPEEDRIMGRRWANGAWQAETLVSVNLPGNYSAQTAVCSDRWGTLYCVWEYWGDGPQSYFSYTRDYEYAQTPTPLNTPPPPPTATITPTFTSTATRTFTLTPTVTNTPRSRTPTLTPTPGVEPNLLTW